jgi:RNA polymerase sigma-70 factor (ECF subfamily)
MDLEEQIRRLREKGDLRGAATRALEGYGAELFGFLVALLRNEHDASEVFSQTSEDLWVGLRRFEGRSSMRTWLYALARHAAARFRRAPHRRAALHVTPSDLRDVAQRIRTQTQLHLRSEVKNQFAAIRDSLDEDDRALLVLRVDRAMSWAEIASVIAAPESTAEELKREAARLRKRFQSVKGEIHARAREAGLIFDEES